MDDPDLVLFERWCADDAVAGNALFKRHFQSLYQLFQHKTRGEVDDLVQETFLECLKSKASFQQRSSFRTYLFAIARHVLWGHWRRASNAPATLDFDEISIASLSTSIGSRLAGQQTRERLIAAMHEITVDQQLLLELFYWQDLDRNQLATVFEVETATIGSRLSRARDALRDLLTDADHAPLSTEQLESWIRKMRG
jgi:RNA polymerase sigma-70 factor (ECF subfamily)